MKNGWLCFFAAVGFIFAVSPSALAQQKAPPPSDDWMMYKSPYIGEQNDLSNPHRTAEEVIIWSQQRATDAMSFMSTFEKAYVEENAKINGADFKGEEMNAKLSRLRGIFSKKGWNEYASYIKQSKIADMVREENYSVTTIVNGNSLIVDSGTVEGSYHWLVKLPLMVTFTLRDSENQPQSSPAADFELVMQIGRMKESKDEDGIGIEGWKITAKSPQQ